MMTCAPSMTTLPLLTAMVSTTLSSAKLRITIFPVPTAMFSWKVTTKSAVNETSVLPPAGFNESEGDNEGGVVSTPTISLKDRLSIAPPFVSGASSN